ncbi:hypothetical protein DFH08DRAFT_797460 [Mycena albidolilacea]|uniref:Fungal-type protein kinase domain-containing protein n=1 Tax=Mycena albidolilacea TaxID=1033008 RepID=A0AAD7F351_9AGAR|nr:hypothetical protein DFH08DRAFT_797460 [Mycena albidolilacea]
MGISLLAKGYLSCASDPCTSLYLHPYRTTRQTAYKRGGITPSTTENFRTLTPRLPVSCEATMPQNFDGITWGIVGVENFLRKYMTPLTDETSMVEDIQTRTAILLDRVKQDIKNETTEDTKTLRPSLVAYLAELVSKFRNKPISIRAPGRRRRRRRLYKPDITVSRPRITFEPTQWAHAGTVVELKYKTDIFEDADSDINDWDTDRLEILVHLTGSARSLLQFFRSCHVYVVTPSIFNWLEEQSVFPTFFLRLYNPPGSYYMDGEDDTIRDPTAEEKLKLYAALCRHGFYAERYPTFEEATKYTRCIKAARFDFEDGKRVSKVDAWRPIYRRPELDFYDAIGAHCEKNNIDAEKEGLAQCRGGVDLAVEGASLRWNPVLHATRSTKSSDPTLERRHTRTLLTLVGTPLNSFESTKSLAEALRNAVRHHRIASDAGVLHRDVSEGNVLFEEVSDADGNLKGFLVDWDYAEFTPAGLDTFHARFLERVEQSTLYQSVDKSLKDFTGTPPFVAIKMIQNTDEDIAEEETLHAAEHDLESVYWLLIWMILRHTHHGRREGDIACSKLFDDNRKVVWFYRRQFTQSGPLFRLAEDLVRQVKLQNPSYYSEVPVQKMTHAKVLETFETHLKAADWPTNDPGLPFRLPRIHPDKQEKAESLHRFGLDKQSQRSARESAKRSRESDDGGYEGSPTVASASSDTTAVASDGSRKARRVRLS